LADWSQYTMNASVCWPQNEKIIGVLGFSPIATADFINKLVCRKLNKEWLYPRIIIDIDTKAPSRGRFFELGETDPVPYIRQDIAILHERGADFVVVPCNTAHILYERFACNSPVPIPNIVDVTCLAAANACINNPIVLCSASARDYGLYGKVLKNSIEFPEQSIIQDGIEAIKQNKDARKIAEQIVGVIYNLKNADGIIYGCTEIGVLMQFAELQLPVIDSNKALADFCFEFANAHLVQNIRMSA